MCKKLLPSVLVLIFLIFGPVNAHAAFTCDGATVAGAFSGQLVGADDSGTPFSSFLFLTVFSDGTFDILSLFSEPGLAWQQLQGTGVWTPFFTTDGFCIVMLTVPGVEAFAFLGNIADNANSIQLSSPNNPNFQAGGMLQRSGI